MMDVDALRDRFRDMFAGIENAHAVPLLESHGSAVSRVDDIPDPLREEFERLERDVKARERRERQARCPHDTTYLMRSMGGDDWRLCADCGATLPAE